MYRANDINGNSVYIDDVTKDNKYFCPACNELLITKLGTRKKHHFSHYPDTQCTDNWKYGEISEWHLGWQNYFNKENREVYIKGESESHRADVFVKNTVIEFQHSPISSEDFNKRNQFYSKNADHVVWIFDMRSKKTHENQISLNNDYTFNWEKGNLFQNTFIDFNNYNGKITVYFEIEKIVNNTLSNVLLCIVDFEKKKAYHPLTTKQDIINFNFLKDYIDSPNLQQYVSVQEILSNDLLYIKFLQQRKEIQPPQQRYRALPGARIDRVITQISANRKKHSQTNKHTSNSYRKKRR